MVLSRFSMGYWTGMIPVIFNLIACTGWASTYTQFTTLSRHFTPLTVGRVIYHLTWSP
jgi:purine-cytosine permease-like protein